MPTLLLRAAAYLSLRILQAVQRTDALFFFHSPTPPHPENRRTPMTVPVAFSLVGSLFRREVPPHWLRPRLGSQNHSFSIEEQFALLPIRCASFSTLCASIGHFAMLEYSGYRHHFILGSFPLAISSDSRATRRFPFAPQAPHGLPSRRAKE